MGALRKGLRPKASWEVPKGPEVAKGGPESVLRGPGRSGDCGRLSVGDSDESGSLRWGS